MPEPSQEAGEQKLAPRLELKAQVQRKDSSLPRYVVIPAADATRLQLTETTRAEVVVNGTAIGRRNLKRWSPSRQVWFFDLTEKQARQAGVETGDSVTVSITLAEQGLPKELQGLIAEAPDAKKRWEALTRSQQRMLADHVRSAKQPTTRRRRAKKALGLLDS